MMLSCVLQRTTHNSNITLEPGLHYRVLQAKHCHLECEKITPLIDITILGKPHVKIQFIPAQELFFRHALCHLGRWFNFTSKRAPFTSIRSSSTNGLQSLLSTDKPSDQRKRAHQRPDQDYKSLSHQNGKGPSSCLPRGSNEMPVSLFQPYV